jgi:hypothetical protein
LQSSNYLTLMQRFKSLKKLSHNSYQFGSLIIGEHNHYSLNTLQIWVERDFSTAMDIIGLCWLPPLKHIWGCTTCIPGIDHKIYSLNPWTITLEYNRPSSTDKMALVGPTYLKFFINSTGKSSRKMKYLESAHGRSAIDWISAYYINHQILHNFRQKKEWLYAQDKGNITLQETTTYFIAVLDICKVDFGEHNYPINYK